MSEILRIWILYQFTLICQKAADNLLRGTTLTLAFPYIILFAIERDKLGVVCGTLWIQIRDKTGDYYSVLSKKTTYEI